MNWDAIGAIGEIVGAMAVVISLIYLATQIQIQNNESRLAAVHEILVGVRESLQIITSGNLSDVISKANDDFESLSDSEALKIFAAILPMLRLWEEAYIQNEQGRLENRVWDGINTQYAAYLSYPAIKRVWDVRCDHFDKKFKNHVQSVQVTEISHR